MKIYLKVKPNSKREKVEKTGENEFFVRVNALANEGKANSGVIRLLSEYFDIPKSAVIILKGEKSRNKIAEITEAQ